MIRWKVKKIYIFLINVNSILFGDDLVRKLFLSRKYFIFDILEIMFNQTVLQTWTYFINCFRSYIEQTMWNLHKNILRVRRRIFKIKLVF